jgi:tetraacyldisaccharide 4'-kinase
MRWVRFILFPFSFLFLIVVYFRNLFYKQGWMKVEQLSVPIVSIGNLSTGGTGKTPMACFVLAHYLERGIKVGYLSRGYGRQTKGYRRVVEHADGARLYGDEPVLIANRFPKVPVAVCEDRVSGVKRMIQESGVEFIVLDDAFQHRKIARDLDIIMIDATQMPDRDLLLPAGNLREPLSSLKRAGMVVLNKIPEHLDADILLRRLKHPRIGITKAEFAEVVFFRPVIKAGVSPNTLLNQPVIVFSGIGNNEQFFSQLKDMGVDIRKSFYFPDHHMYTAEDLRKITLEYRVQVPESPDLIILTTEKDYCRLNSVNLPAVLAPYPCAYITMDLKWQTGNAEMVSALDSIIPSLNTYDREATI